jgi:protein ImuB
MLLKLLRLRLQGDTPGAPIVGIVVAAEAARPRAMQGGLFLPSFPDPEKLELTIARITHVVGEDNVGSPALMDTHRPGEFQMRRFVARPDAVEKSAARSSAAENHFPDAAAASFRFFRPALPAKLELRDQRPARLIFQGKRGEVLTASGPWRTSGDWWREDPWDQDEWDLEIRFPTAVKREKARADSVDKTGECSRYRIYYDAVRKSWFVRGIYD